MQLKLYQGDHNLKKVLETSNGCQIRFLGPQKSPKPQFVFLNFFDKEKKKE